MKSLVDLLTRHVPLYATVVRGYDAGQIASLESALGRTLPEPYRDFLASIGANIGFSTGEVRFDMESVLDLVANRGAIPKHLVPIAADEGTSYCDYYLDFSHPSGEDDALVVRIPAGARIMENHLPISWSFRDFIHSWGFKEVRMAALAEKTSLLWYANEGDREALPRVSTLTAVMVKLGFEPLAITSPAAQLYERGDCAGAVYQAPFRDAFSLFLSARDRRGLLRVVEAVRDALPLTLELGTAMP